LQTIDLIIAKISKKHPTKTWTKKLIQSQFDIYKEKNKSGNYFEFCKFIEWYFNELKKRPKYK